MLLSNFYYDPFFTQKKYLNFANERYFQNQKNRNGKLVEEKWNVLKDKKEVSLLLSWAQCPNPIILLYLKMIKGNKCKRKRWPSSIITIVWGRSKLIKFWTKTLQAQSPNHKRVRPSFWYRVSRLHAIHTTKQQHPAITNREEFVISLASFLCYENRSRWIVVSDPP